MGKEEYTKKDLITALILGLVAGIVLGMVFWDISITGNIREQLGSSICEEEYGRDYESYYDGVLKCKPFKESYDGIRVEVPKGTQS